LTAYFGNFFIRKLIQIFFILSTHFGPFEGVLRKDEEETQGQDYGWDLMDSEKTRTVGFVDPGKNPDKVSQWLAYVNCPLEEGKLFTFIFGTI
jgi:hypothetical protein